MVRIAAGEQNEVSELTEADFFTIDVSNGRVASCEEAAAREYANCKISAGLANGVEPDSLYFRFEREADGDEGLTVFLRADEMNALICSCSGALWLHQVRVLERAEVEHVD